jgi:predicted CoA-binding protein
MSVVVVLGASNNPSRVSYQAIQRLRHYRHEVIPVNPRGGAVQGLEVLPSLKAITVPVDTVTMYVGPQHQSLVLEDILALRPQRVIFNPGSENPASYARLRSAGIHVEEACTLVLLSTRQFEHTF